MTRPFSARHWHEVETWPRERIAEFQLARLREQLSYVHTHSDYYRARWDGLGFDPRDLRSADDLSKLPVVTKADYVADLAAHPPWGSAVAAAESDRRRVHFSSGTTSGPTPVQWTQADLTRWADLYARSAYSQGIRDTDVYQCLFSYAWFVGGLGATAGYERIGATVLFFFYF